MSVPDEHNVSEPGAYAGAAPEEQQRSSTPQTPEPVDRQAGRPSRPAREPP